MVGLQFLLLLGILLVYFSQAPKPDVSVVPVSLRSPREHKGAWPLILLPAVQPAEGGIPGLHKWLLETFPSAIERLERRSPAIKTDHLLFDLNQLLHQAAASVEKRRRQAACEPGKDYSHAFREDTDYRTCEAGECAGSREHATVSRGGTRGRLESTAGKFPAPPDTADSREQEGGSTKLQTSAKHAAENEEETVLRRLLQLLSATLRKVRPRRSVVFALDGVPPLAKFLTVTGRQQRAVWQCRAGAVHTGNLEAPLGPLPVPQKERGFHESLNDSRVLKTQSPGAATYPASLSQPRQSRVETAKGEEAQQLGSESCDGSEGADVTSAAQQGDGEIAARSSYQRNHEQRASNTEAGLQAARPSDRRDGAGHEEQPQIGARTLNEELLDIVNLGKRYTEAGVEEEAKSAETPDFHLRTDRPSRYRIPPYLLIPGTRFMEKVEEACRRFARQRLCRRRDCKLRFFVSGSNSYGEGELKLVDWINAHRVDVTNEDCGRSAEKHMCDGATLFSAKKVMSTRVCSLEGGRDVEPQDRRPVDTSSVPSTRRSALASRRCFSVSSDDQSNSGSDKQFSVGSADSIVIVGGDGDLLVQALASPGNPDLYVYSPQRMVEGSDGRCRGNSHLVRTDLALLCILNGNDYLPKAAGFTFQHFFDAYSAARKRPKFKQSSLIDAVNKTFNLDFFIAFLEELDHISSLRRIALQQLLSPAPGTASHMSPLSLLNQLVAQGYLSPSRRISNVTPGGTETPSKDHCAQNKDADIPGTHVQHGAARYPAEHTISGKQINCSVEPSVLKWRYEGDTPFGSGNFRAILRVPCNALPRVLCPNTIEVNTLPVGETANVSTPTLDGTDDCVCFTGQARDKKGAQQQAALGVLQQYFPAWLKCLHGVDHGVRNTVPGGNEWGTAKCSTGPDACGSETGKPDTAREEDYMRKREDVKEQLLLQETVPKEWHLAAPLFSAAASTLQATSPANTLNNLCLKVFKQPAKLWDVVPRGTLDASPQANGGHEHCEITVSRSLPSTASSPLSPLTMTCRLSDSGGAASDVAFAAISECRDGESLQSELSPDRLPDQQVAIQTAASDAAPDTAGDFERPQKDQDALIALDVGKIRLFAASAGHILKSGGARQIISRVQLPTNKRQRKHSFSMQVLQWLAPPLYQELRAAGWRLNGSFTADAGAQNELNFKDETDCNEEERQSDGVCSAPSVNGRQSPPYKYDFAQQHLPSQESEHAHLVQNADTVQQLHRPVQQFLTSYFVSAANSTFPGISTDGVSGMHVIEERSLEQDINLAAQKNPHQQNKAAAVDCTETEKISAQLNWLVEADTQRVQEYLKGLLWTIRMYASGVCPDSRWFFPFRKAPSLYSMQKHMIRWIVARGSGSMADSSPIASLSTAAPARDSGHSSMSGQQACRIPLVRDSIDDFVRLPRGVTSSSDNAAENGKHRPVRITPLSLLADSPVVNHVPPALYAAAILPPFVFHWLQLLLEQQQHRGEYQGEKKTVPCSLVPSALHRSSLRSARHSGVNSRWTDHGPVRVLAEARVIEHGLGSEFASGLLKARTLLEHICAVDLASSNASSSLLLPDADKDFAHVRERFSASFDPASYSLSDKSRRFAEVPTKSEKPYQALPYVAAHLHRDTGQGGRSVQETEAFFVVGTSGEKDTYRDFPLERLMLPLPSAVWSVPRPSGYSPPAAEPAAPAFPSLSPRHILHASLLLCIASRAQLPMEKSSSVGSPDASSGQQRSRGLGGLEGMKDSTEAADGSVTGIAGTSSAPCESGSRSLACSTENFAHESRISCYTPFLPHMASVAKALPVAYGLSMGAKPTESDSVVALTSEPPQYSKVVRPMYWLTNPLHPHTEEKREALKDLSAMLENTYESVWTCISLRYSTGRSKARCSRIVSGLSDHSLITGSKSVYDPSSAKRTPTKSGLTSQTKPCGPPCTGARGSACKESACEIQGTGLGEKRSQRWTHPWRLGFGGRCEVEIVEKKTPIFFHCRVCTPRKSSLLSTYTGCARISRRQNKHIQTRRRAHVVEAAPSRKRRESERQKASSQGEPEAHSSSLVTGTGTRRQVGYQVSDTVSKQGQEEPMGRIQMPKPPQQSTVAQRHSASQVDSLPSEMYPMQRKNSELVVRDHRAQSPAGTWLLQVQHPQKHIRRKEDLRERLQQTQGRATHGLCDTKNEKSKLYAAYDREVSREELLLLSPGARHFASLRCRAVISTVLSFSTALFSVRRRRSLYDALDLPNSGEDGRPPLWESHLFRKAFFSFSRPNDQISTASRSYAFRGPSVASVEEKDTGHVCSDKNVRRAQTCLSSDKFLSYSLLQNLPAGLAPYRFLCSKATKEKSSPQFSSGTSAWRVAAISISSTFERLLRWRSCANISWGLRYTWRSRQSNGSGEPLRSGTEQQQAASYFTPVPNCLLQFGLALPVHVYVPPYSSVNEIRPIASVCQKACKKCVCYGSARTTFCSCAACGKRRRTPLCGGLHLRRYDTSSHADSASSHSFDIARTFLLTSASGAQGGFRQAACRVRTIAPQGKPLVCGRSLLETHRTCCSYSLSAGAETAGVPPCLSVLVRSKQH